jgi:phospholipase C
VELIDPEGNYTKAFPCFDRSTLIDRVEDAGLTWRYYSANAIWNAPNAISSICVPKSVDGKLVCSGSEWSLDSKTSKVLSDITKCNLPNIAWITPTAVNSDHAGDNKAGGPSWVASIVNAIGTSSCGYWQNTAILVTWDDWGGWYDHVPPPQIGQSNGWGQSYVYGFRVPLLVVSAYTPAGYVSNVTHDFGSLLRFVESNFDLRLIGPGTFADSYADDLADFFTLNSSRPFKVIPAQYDADHFINEPESLDNPDND